MDNKFSDPFPSPAKQDIDLRPYLHLLWRKRFTLLVASVLGATIAAGALLMIPRQYTAEVSIGVSRPPFVGGSVDTTSAASVLPLISSVSIAGKVINEFHLENPPYLASPSSFFTKTLTIATSSSVITISGTFQDRDLIIKVLNRVAELEVVAVQDAIQQEAARARKALANAQQDYDDATSRLIKFEETAQVDTMRTDANAALNERSQLRDLSIQIEADKARLAKAEQELAGRSRVETVHRSIDTDPAVMDAARNGGASNPLQLSLKSEVIDPVFQELDEDIATRRTELAGLEREQAQLTAKNLDGPSLKQFDRLYKSEIELDRLKNEQQTAEKNYLQTAAASDPERLTSATQTPALQVLAPAVPPVVPDPRRMAPLILAGFVGGFLIAAFSVIVGELVQTAAKPR